MTDLTAEGKKKKEEKTKRRISSYSIVLDIRNMFKFNLHIRIITQSSYDNKDE